MTRRFSALSVVAGVCMMAMLMAERPAFAQLGSLTGKVVDEQGNPVPDAEVSLDFTGEMSLHFKVKTDKNGVWTRAGLIAVGGRWNVSAKKGELTGMQPNIEVALGGAKPVPDIVLHSGGAASPAEAEARAKKAAEAKKVLEEVNAALTANDFDTAIAKLTEATTKIDKCSECFLRLGDIYAKRQQYDKAEEAYKSTIAIDEKSAEAYEGLAVVYNSQKKFDEAGTASNKAIALRGASGGGGDATSAFNAGAILVNQRKMAEAQAQFEKAIQLDPKMAEAHYQLAMTLINQGKVPDAIKSLEQYLVVAPSGPHADEAKMMIPELKKMQ